MSRGVPPALAAFVRVANLAVISFGMIALLAAIAGQFHLAIVLPVGSLLTSLLSGFPRLGGRGSAEPVEPREPTGRLANVVATIVVVFVVANSAYALAHRSEHVEINRDPGFYVNAAKWIVTDRSLEVDAADEVFADETDLSYETPGLPSPAPGTLHFQGNHLLPALMAVGGAAAGDAGLFAVPIALGALALLTIYTLLARRSSPLAAATGTVALGTSLLWVAFARDAYTEVPSLGLAAFALAQLPIGTAPRPRAAIHIGLALGALCALRIDAPLLLLLWPLLIASWWHAARDDTTNVATRRATVALIGGFTSTFAVAMVDLFSRSPEYFADLAGRTIALWVAFAFVVVVAIASVVVPPFRSIGVSVRGQWEAKPRVRFGIAGVVSAVLAALWFVRPVVETVRGPAQNDVAAMQQRLGLTVDITRKFSEESFAWQAWYLGVPLVVAAIVGITMIVAHRNIARRFAPLLLVSAPASLLYLYRPNIFPDHTWVMRRFLATLTLLLVTGAVVALDALLRWRGTTAGIRHVTTVLVAVAIVAAPALATAPVRAGADQANYLDAIRPACRFFGRNAAIVVERNDDDSLYKRLPAALRGWCKANVAIADVAIDDEHLARWRALGTRHNVAFFVIAGTEARLGEICPNAPATRFRAENPFLIEQTLTERPNGYAPQSLEFVTIAATGCGP